MYFVTCPKQGLEMEAVVLHRVAFLEHFSCPKQGQDFKPLAAPIHPKMGQVPPPPPLTPGIRRYSTVALYWIKGQGEYRQFVDNRLHKIQQFQ